MNDSLLGYPVSISMRRDLLQDFWKTCQPDLKHTHDMSPYFAFYETRCQQFLKDGGIHISVRQHHELVDLAEKILGKSTRDEIRSSMIKHLSNPNLNASDAIDMSFSLCASLLFMIDIGGNQYGISGSSPLQWPLDQSIRQAVAQHFERQKGNLEPENARLGRLFTARNLTLVGGLKVKWTSNLVDHLLLADDDQTVFVFHFVGFLRFQNNFANGIFPNDFIDETLRTLALLFPEIDRKSRRWVKSQIEFEHLDPSLAKCGTLRQYQRRFESFPYWHDRLIILKQAFDESRPRTLTQWWNDRRNSVQWYTFWVAILVFVFTIVFGLIQSVEGGLQTWIAWKQYKSSSP